MSNKSDDEFARFKELTRRLVAIPKKEVAPTKTRSAKRKSE